MALIDDGPRGATVMAMEDSVLFTIDRDTYLTYVKESTVLKRQKYHNFLNEVGVLESLYNYDRENLCDALEVETYQDKDIIIKEGAKAKKVYFLYSGICDAFTMVEGEDGSRVRKDLLSFEEKDYFGELALMNNEPQPASVEARGDVQLLAIDKRTFTRLMDSIGYDLRKNLERYSRRSDH